MKPKTSIGFRWAATIFDSVVAFLGQVLISNLTESPTNMEFILTILRIIGISVLVGVVTYIFFLLIKEYVSKLLTEHDDDVRKQLMYLRNTIDILSNDADVGRVINFENTLQRHRLGDGSINTPALHREIKTIRENLGQNRHKYGIDLNLAEDALARHYGESYDRKNESK